MTQEEHYCVDRVSFSRTCTTSRASISTSPRVRDVYGWQGDSARGAEGPTRSTTARRGRSKHDAGARSPSTLLAGPRRGSVVHLMNEPWGRGELPQPSCPARKLDRTFVPSWADHTHCKRLVWARLDMLTDVMLQCAHLHWPTHLCIGGIRRSFGEIVFPKNRSPTTTT